MKQLINLTPHMINIYSNNQIIKSIPSTGVARVVTEKNIVNQINGIDVITILMKEVIGLPEQKEDIYYIVSRAVAENSDRNDLLIPSETIRDSEGKIIGCSSFSIIKK